MTTTLFENGLIQIPEVFRTADALKAGQRCDIERLGHGEYRLRVEESGGGERNWVQWLLDCPEKGWLGEADRSELTSLEPPAVFAE